MTHQPDHEVELFRDGDAYEVYVDLPGYDRDDVDVRWRDGRLRVSASRPEGSSRVYSRRVSLPYSIDAEGITASYDDGVLAVRLPVREDEDRPGKTIEVTG